MTDQPFRTRMLPIAILLLLSSAGLAKSQGIDFYVLSLSWSPTYCATQKGASRSPQCSGEEDFRFIVHGLWPQHENGYPEFCPTREPQRVPRSVGNIVFDIMPSMGLIGHQWRKHGSCSGLNQRDYLTETRRAFERIQIPKDFVEMRRPTILSAEEIERRFVESNPGMTRRGIAAGCEGRQFEEIRICLTRDLSFRDCAEVDRRGCRLNRIELPPPR